MALAHEAGAAVVQPRLELARRAVVHQQLAARARARRERGRLHARAGPPRVEGRRVEERGTLTPPWKPWSLDPRSG